MMNYKNSWREIMVLTEEEKAGMLKRLIESYFVLEQRLIEINKKLKKYDKDIE